MEYELERERFWELIEQSRKNVENCEDQAKRLTALLTELEAQEIVEFRSEFHKCMDAAYRWDLWAVAYIINGGCSDDDFEYFMCWLIAQGKEYFEAALQQPERAADNADVENQENECEDLLYCPMFAYEEKTGDKIPMARGGTSGAAEPNCLEWGEEDLPDMFPALCKKFGL